jgi:segregation and condensation protein B
MGSEARVTEVRFDPEELVSQLVAILFASGEAVERGAVQRTLGITGHQLGLVLDCARERGTPGLMIQEHDEGLRLVTSPETALFVRRFLQAGNATRLSPAALESLAVIAYSQPATRAQVQEARGVHSDGAIETLLQHGLITEIGRADGPGRPALFETTPECLALLGISSLRDLPSLTAPEPGSSSEPIRLPTREGPPHPL